MDGQIEQLLVPDFDEAPRKLINRMMDSQPYYNHTAKSFFFEGWLGHGLGASAILRATAELLKSEISDPNMRNQFEKVIHVDCSLWKNRRTLQRAIAEELNLGHVMPIFDRHDKDDDFRGLDVISRVEIPSIGSEIYAYLTNKRFVMIFHYGGEEDIDLAACGIPNPDFGTYASGKLLWSSYGRFKLSEKKIKLETNSIYFRIIPLYPYFGEVPSHILRRSLHEEAAEVIGHTGMDAINPEIVLDCFLYSLFLIEQLQVKSIGVDYGWDTHACNYWICDGILQGDIACQVGNALYGVIHMLRSSYGAGRLGHYLDRHRERYEGWISVSSNQLAQYILVVPINASSYFLTFGGDGHLALQNNLFQLSSNLRVLKLCKCRFDFACPPFRCCHNLRFLWLDHCTNSGGGHIEGPCFLNLLVLDIRFTCFVLLAETIELMTNLREVNTKGVSWRTISHAWMNLQNLHKLRVTESLDVITVDTCPSIDMVNLELLDLSGNIHMKSLPEMSSSWCLKMLVLDGCSSLWDVELEGAPQNLESFSFDGYGPAKKWTHAIQLPKEVQRPNSRTSLVQEAVVRRISLKGFAQLKNIFLRGLPNLQELDLSGTSIETLNLIAMDVAQLKKLFLLGCEQLRSLLWDGENHPLEVMHVDTRGMTGSTIYYGEQSSSGNEVIMVFTDGRFIWSIIKGLHAMCGSKVYLHISSKIHNRVNITKSIEDVGHSQEGLVPTCPFSLYNDIAINKDSAMCSSLVWGHCQLFPLDVHIEIGEGGHHLESMQECSYFYGFIKNQVQSLHVHDNVSIATIIPGLSSFLDHLEWFHVERCPNMHTVFSSWHEYKNFNSLRIFSASDLLMAHCIWSRCLGHYCLEGLQHIYLHNCPKLVFFLPISSTLPNMETIQIAYCHNVQHIFPLYEYHLGIESGVTFKKLRHIKLYHLHKLEKICEVRLSAPALETVSLRDCWGLRRLPSVSQQGPKPVVDCEKDWWDRLEWDGFESNHEPSLFETRHSAYYKKTLPRVSVLR